MTIIRSLITVTLFTAFVVLWFWAWRRERREDFEVAARMPLEDEATSTESKQS